MNASPTHACGPTKARCNEHERLPPAILLIGPTASGKTSLALEAAARFPVEIISVDSAQVFIDMDIGTAKPDAATRARFPHHLIDLITPEARYSVAQFRRDALAAMTDITARGKVPLLTGGTLLYVKALREGLADLPPADAALRARIDAEARALGWPALHAELARRDAVTAARLAPTDGQRIQRALEVARLTGRPLTDFFTAQNRAASSPTGLASPLPWHLLSLALVPDERAWLHERIARRFDEMLAAGLVDEVENLRATYRLDDALPAMRCVGYRQVWDMLEGRLPAAELRERGIYATRQLAKRQLTWLRHMTGIERHNSQAAALETTIMNTIAGFIEAHTSAPPA